MAYGFGFLTRMFGRRAGRSRVLRKRPIRIFLSYARGDDEAFVRRLYTDLVTAGFDVWFDRASMPSRQLTFYQEIRDAIAGQDRLVLVVGPNAARSDYVKQEWRNALDIGLCVNPIVRLDEKADNHTTLDGRELVPTELSYVDAQDFRDDARYSESFANLVRQLSEPLTPMARLVAVPKLPLHYVAHAERLTALRQALLSDLYGPVPLADAVTRLGVHGMGGIGKSVLASALARDQVVRRACPDGVFWVHLGPKPNVVELQRRLARELGGDALFDEPAAGKEQLHRLLQDRAVLLVLDNAWAHQDAAAFDVIGPRCKFLLTTRDAGLAKSLAATSFSVELPTNAESRMLLAATAGIPIESLPVLAGEIVAECERLPLAIALCGGMVRGGTPWPDVAAALRQHDLRFVSTRYTDQEQHRSLWRALELSVLALADAPRQRFAELAVFAAEDDVPETAVVTLWTHTGAMSELHARQLLTEFQQRSLIRLERVSGDRGGESRVMSLHDLMQDLVEQLAPIAASSPASLHMLLVSAYEAKCSAGWHTAPNDGYIVDRLASHLAAAGRIQAVYALLEDQRWLECRRALDPSMAGFAADVRIGLELAGANHLSNYPRLAALSLLWSRVTSRAREVPLEVLEAITRLGQWRKALDYCRQVTPPERRLLGIRLISGILRESDNSAPCRAVAEEGLRLAQSLDPDLYRGFGAPDESQDALWRKIAEKNRDDRALRLEDLFAAYVKGETLEAVKRLDAEVVLLAPRLSEITLHSFAVSLQSALPHFLTRVDFPRGESTAATAAELQTLDMIKLLAKTTGTKAIDRDLVRGLTAELLAVIDRPEHALILIASADKPMVRFSALAEVAVAFGRAHRDTAVRQAWSLVKDCAGEKYVGAKADRCQIMLRMAEAAFLCGNSELADEAMGSAIVFSIEPGLLELPQDLATTPAEAERWMRRLNRRKQVEKLSEVFSRDTNLAKVQATCHVLEAITKHCPDKPPPHEAAENLLKDVDAASPATWEMNMEEFERDHAVALCLVGSSQWILGNRERAEEYWKRADALSKRLENTTMRAQVAASIADAHARAGNPEPAGEFIRKFLLLVDTDAPTKSGCDAFIVRWAEAYIRACQPDEAVALMDRALDQEDRIGLSATLALMLARAGDVAKCRELVRLTIESPQPRLQDHRTAVASAKLLAALDAIGDSEQGLALQQSALADINSIAGEPDRLRALMRFIETLVHQDDVTRAAAVCQEASDPAVKGILGAAFLRSAVAQGLAAEHIEQAADWVLDVISNQMKQSDYHFPLAMLTIEPVLRGSTAIQAVMKRNGVEANAVDGFLYYALNGLNTLCARDAEIGSIRKLNVMQIAAGVDLLPVDAIAHLAGRGDLEVWQWLLTDAATKRDDASMSAEDIPKALNAARLGGPSEVWYCVSQAVRVLFERGQMAETWARLQAVEMMFK